MRGKEQTFHPEHWRRTSSLETGPVFSILPNFFVPFMHRSDSSRLEHPGTRKHSRGLWHPRRTPHPHPPQHIALETPLPFPPPQRTSTMTKPDTWKYTTQVRGPVTAEQAVAALQNHQHFLETDPNLLSFQADVAPQGGALHPLPDDVSALRVRDARCYEVVDRMPGVALFAKLLRGLSTATIYYQITDTRDGIFVFLQAPMGVTQERRWAVEQGGEGDGEGLRIVEYVSISCTRLMYSSVKSQQDLHWKDVHAGYAKKMGGEVGEQSAGQLANSD